MNRQAKYEATVSSVGETAAVFAAEGILVFFGPDAPEELHEFAIITDLGQLQGEVEVGDDLTVADHLFPIVGVGAVANQNLASLGHLVVKFNGLAETELPGDVSVGSQPAPVIEPGVRVAIFGAIVEADAGASHT